VHRIWPPHQPRLAIAKEDEDGVWQLHWQVSPLSRQNVLKEIGLHSIVDVTGDTAVDIILVDQLSGRTTIVTQAGGDFKLHQLPGKCFGSLVVRDALPVPEIVRDGCSASGRVAAVWSGKSFALK
jgi:hypothetical protein